MKKFLINLGVLRICLFLFAIALLFIRPAPGTDAARSGIEMITTLIAPAITPIIFFLLMFDFMMSRIRMSDIEVREKFKIISYVELSVAGILLLAWLPYFLAIGK